MRRLLLILLVVSAPAFAVDYYVAPGGNDGDPGSEAEPWATIGKANSTLTPGDRVLIKSGTYTQAIRPSNSGTSNSARITYEAFGDGNVIFSGAFNGSNEFDVGAIALGQRDYVTVDGGPDMEIRVLAGETLSSAFGTFTDGSYNIVENVYMDGNPDRGFHLSIGFLTGTHETSYNILRGNHLIGRYCAGGCTEDLVTLAKDAHHNVIEDNILEDCSHATLYIADVAPHSNVVRNNVIRNPFHGALSVFQAGYYHLVEGNLLWASGDAASQALGPGNALQGGASRMIARYNVITRGGSTNNSHSSLGGFTNGSGFSYGAAGTAADNRIYNNTIVKNMGPAYVEAWYPPAEGLDIGRNRLVNNIMMGNTNNVQGGVEAYYESTDSVPGGLDTIWYTNVIGQSAGTSIIYGPIFGSMTAAQALTVPEYPRDPAFFDILQDDPDFVDFDGDDFRLNDTSPLIDRGAELTKVATADTGSGTALIVDDARYFYAAPPGFPAWMGVEGDMIAVGTATNIVQIAAVDYDTNIITLASSISRSDGQDIMLYSGSDGKRVLYGSSSDVGAFEYGSADPPGDPPPPNKVTNLTITEPE